MTSSAQGNAQERSFDFARVDDLFVMIGYGRDPVGPPTEVFLLETRLSPAPGARWDDSAYLDAVEGILTAGGGRPPPHAVTVSRTHADWGGRTARADVMMSVAMTDVTRAVPLEVRDAVTTAFRTMMSAAGRAPLPGVAHDEAIAVARRLVATVWPDVDPTALAVSDEEHKVATRAWSLGLVTHDRTRYEAEVGFVEGDPATVHVRRSHEPEVVDSVGT